jgi:hypothetical protein
LRKIVITDTCGEFADTRASFTGRGSKNAWEA